MLRICLGLILCQCLCQAMCGTKIWSNMILKVMINEMCQSDTISIKSETGQEINILTYNDRNGWVAEHYMECRAFYLDYGILLFDSEKVGYCRYKIYCNGQWCYVNLPNDKVEFIPWSEFIVSDGVYCYTSVLNPVKNAPSEHSSIINVDYENIRIEGKKVKGEWLYVELYNIEQISHPISSGWLRWRDANNLLIKLFYAL